MCDKESDKCPAGEELREILRCSFCGKTENEVVTIVAGEELEGSGRAHICDVCVTGCIFVIRSHVAKLKMETVNKMRPKSKLTEGISVVENPDMKDPKLH